MSTQAELKQNVLAEKLEGAVQWGIENRPKVIGALVSIVVVILISSVFIIRKKENADLNWTRLTQAQVFMNQKQTAQSRQILNEIIAAVPGTPAALHATFYLGDLNTQETKWDDALSNYQTVVSQTSNEDPLHPLALVNMGYAQEQKKDYSTAASTYQQFLDAHQDHFMAPRIQLALGRSHYLAGNIEPAKKALGNLVDLYPTSPWAEKARRIMDKIETR